MGTAKQPYWSVDRLEEMSRSEKRERFAIRGLDIKSGAVTREPERIVDIFYDDFSFMATNLAIRRILYVEKINKPISEDRVR